MEQQEYTFIIFFDSYIGFVKRELSLSRLAFLIKFIYIRNDAYFDFDFFSEHISNYMDNRGIFLLSSTQPFKYLFDFILFNYNQLEKLFNEKLISDDLFEKKFICALKVFLEHGKEFGIVSTDGYPRFYEEKIESYSVDDNATSFENKKTPTIRKSLSNFLEHSILKNCESNSYDLDKNNAEFVNLYLKSMGFHFDLCSDLGTMIAFTKKISKEVETFYKKEHTQSFEDFIRASFNENFCQKRIKMASIFNELVSCFQLWQYEHKFYSYKYHLIAEGKKEDDGETQYSPTDILSDELYAMLFELLKTKALYSTEPHGTIDYTIITDAVFGYCFDVMSNSITSKGYQYFHTLYDEKERKQILKFYYLSTFFENKVANAIEVELSRTGGSQNSDLLPYNPISGFNKNLPLLKQRNLNYLNKYILISPIKIENVLKNTQIYKHNVLETALYNKALMDYYPIFNGMEYTPLMVNLFKGVEELCCDLIKYLEIDKIRDIENLRGFRVDGFSFRYDDWQNDLTLGSLFRLLDSINKYDVDYKGNSIDNINVDVYRSSYARYFQQRKQQFAAFIDDSSEFFDGFDEDVDSVNNSTDSNELLSSVLTLWRKACRNNCVHKDDTLTKPRVNFTFDFTYMIIAMLVEWAWLIK